MRICVFTLIVCLASAALPSWAEENAAELRLRAYISVFNSGDRPSIEAFLKQHYPSFPISAVNTMMYRRRYSGGYLLHRIEEATPTHVAALMQEKESESAVRGYVEINTAKPHEIVRMAFPVVPMPPGFSPQRLSESEALEAAQKRLAADTAADRFSGAVAIAHNGKVIFSRAYGLADRDKKIPNSVDTSFRIGSMSKMFTATAILQLVQAHKIDLGAPVGTYLTDYPNKDVATKATIHQLLTHTGGTGDFFGPEFDAHRLELRTVQDYIALYGARGLKFEPGTAYNYSNYGYVLLGAVIEKVTGHGYYEYIRDHIYKPAGMSHTGSEPEEIEVPKRSNGYMGLVAGTPPTSNIDTLAYRGSPAGGGYSTVRDLVAFATALRNHRLLDTEHTKLLTTGKVDTRQYKKYAYGFFESTESGVREFGHSGGAPGMNGVLRIYPQTGYVVAVLSNLDPPLADIEAGFISNRLPLLPH